MGHHPTYFTEFAAAMARADAEVVPLCANPEDFNNRISEVAEDHALRSRISMAEHVNGPRPSKFRPARWRKQVEAFIFFRGLSKRLRAWERRNNRKIDLVFFACIYDWQFEKFHNVASTFPFRCSGLYLHARSFRMPGSPLPYFGIMPCPEKIFGSPQMHSVGILDEGIRDPVSEVIGGKPVFVFPDITDGNLPSGDFPEGFGGKLKALAAGRPIVSLTGHLQWTKGIDVFTQAASHPALRDIFFFLGGEVMWRDISPELRKALESAWEGLPNLYAHLKHLPEKTMNSVVVASDVMVATYRQFPNSSNALTKAALFERPIVVSEGYLMAERVRKYGLGEVVPEGDVEALVAAIQKMVKPEYYNHLRSQARWEDYRQAHSVDRLNKVFRELVASL